MIKIPLELDPNSDWRSITKQLTLIITNNLDMKLSGTIEVIGNVMYIEINHIQKEGK